MAGISSGPTCYRGDSAPATGRVGDIWIDTSSSTPLLKLCISATPTWAEVGGMKPSTRTTLTTPGSSSYAIADGTWVRVILVGAGGGGGGKGGNASVYAGGGSAGATVEHFYKTSGTSISYTIGAKGTGGSTSGSDGSAGGDTRWDRFEAPGGRGGDGYTGIGSNYGVHGGGAEIYTNQIDTSIGTYYADIPITMQGPGIVTCGGAGGKGGDSSLGAGHYAGHPWWTQVTGSKGSASGQGGGGGDSLYGTGGATSVNQTGANASGYGAGGGGAGSTTTTDYVGGDGTDGMIIVEEYGVW